eukprot:15451419-Alexandrium_andersonii.AAC.1
MARAGGSRDFSARLEQPSWRPSASWPEGRSRRRAAASTTTWNDVEEADEEQPIEEVFADYDSCDGENLPM